MPARSRHRTVPDIWPGFVDAISAMLIIVIFLLMVFTLAQSFLSEMLSGRNEALDRLNRQVAELADMLSLERQSNTVLRNDLAQLSSELQSSIATRDTQSTQLATLTDERDDLANTLALRIQEKNRLLANLKDETSRAEKARLRANKVDRELENAFKTISADREKIRVQLATLESLKRDITALQKTKGALEARVTSLAASLDENKNLLTVARDRSKELVASLSTAGERTALAQKKIAEQDVKLAKLQIDADISSKSLTEEQKSSVKARAEVALLNRQLAALRQQLSRIAAALEASETKAKEQEVQIVNLGSKLNAALASKVEELARYRSEFFGKLRELLGDRDDVRVEGDRFVFQSEVLFSSGSADMVGIGRDQIRRLAATLKDIASRIPKNIDWVLRVDGHTDRIPIRTAQFPSNWELSTARALAVVKLLIEDGLPPHRLAAAGFGEHRPLDKTDSSGSLRRNRRIEFKLTGR
ncbi:MAG: peptidoglycan -binding protein [Proteobacteria bacterium]|nr:peptidoglycan -binding protein [Pseudomonadota bacterium]